MISWLLWRLGEAYSSLYHWILEPIWEQGLSFETVTLLRPILAPVFGVSLLATMVFLSFRRCDSPSIIRRWLPAAALSTPLLIIGHVLIEIASNREQLWVDVISSGPNYRSYWSVYNIEMALQYHSLGLIPIAILIIGALILPKWPPHLPHFWRWVVAFSGVMLPWISLILFFDNISEELQSTATVLIGGIREQSCTQPELEAVEFISQLSGLLTSSVLVVSACMGLMLASSAWHNQMRGSIFTLTTLTLAAIAFATTQPMRGDLLSLNTAWDNSHETASIVAFSHARFEESDSRGYYPPLRVALPIINVHGNHHSHRGYFIFARSGKYGLPCPLILRLDGYTPKIIPPRQGLSRCDYSRQDHVSGNNFVENLESAKAALPKYHSQEKIIIEAHRETSGKVMSKALETAWNLGLRNIDFRALKVLSPGMKAVPPLDRFDDILIQTTLVGPSDPNYDDAAQPPHRPYSTWLQSITDGHKNTRIFVKSGKSWR